MNFTALVDLPDMLESMGFDVDVHPDWLEGQCSGSDHYLWTSPTGQQSHDLGPSAYMVHHTAGQSATPPDHQTSKANAWIGLKRGDRLYQYGTGKPTIYLASAGPCRTSSGYGYKPAAWDYTFKEKRAPWRAEGADGSTALNRYAFNVETVCEGNGTTLDRGVWECVVGLGRAIQMIMGKQEMTLGHNSWTKRKVDPDWTVGLPNDGDRCIIDIQDAIAAGDTCYPDVPNDHLFYSDIEWARENGITKVPCGSNYRPDDPVTRGEMAAFMRRLENQMTTKQWASTLRNPKDFDQMVKKGIITAAERDYWITVAPDDPEMQYLRNAATVRGPLY